VTGSGLNFGPQPLREESGEGSQSSARPFRPACPGAAEARPMITEIKQRICCGISMKSEILHD
jgi:hypothetical protein